MAGLRTFAGYRQLERAYTRKSKFKKHNYIRSTPNHKIIRFEMGDKKKTFSHELKLVSKGSLQIRHNAIESTRQIVNRHLQKVLAQNYFFQINMFPHHCIRENKLLGGSKAERMQTGMKKPFGKVVSLGAQIKRGKTILTTYVDERDIEKARTALKKSLSRLPGSYTIQVQANKSRVNPCQE